MKIFLRTSLYFTEDKRRFYAAELWFRALERKFLNRKRVTGVKINRCLAFRLSFLLF